MMAKSRKGHKILAAIIIFFGTLFLVGGLYLLPVGTDAYLYFFIEVLMHGNWLWGDLLATLTAIGLIVFGYVLLRIEGVKLGLKKDRKKRRSRK